MTKSDGKYMEELVQLIEKSIDPYSKVEHDIQLPILTSQNGSTTQCDIVITTGKPPRETITIIEVQDRASKPKINDFRGWQQKLKDVGGQHLICVSKKGFTKAVKEKASQSGNTISLITLSELTSDEIPLDFFNYKFRFHDFDLVSVKNVHFTVSEKSMKEHNIRKTSFILDEINFNERIFSLDKSNLTTLFLICRDTISYPEGKETGKYKIDFNLNNNPIYVLHNGVFLKIGIRFEFEWKNKLIDIPTSILSYEQDEHGTLAWLIEAGHNSSKGPINLKIPLTKDGDTYLITNLSFAAKESMSLSLTKISSPHS